MTRVSHAPVCLPVPEAHLPRLLPQPALSLPTSRCGTNSGSGAPLCSIPCCARAIYPCYYNCNCTRIRICTWCRRGDG